MNEALLETVEVGPREGATAAVIWLHGLGADGNDFPPIVRELQLPADAAVRFVFPHAPVRPVTLNGGMAMRAWYDILGLGAGYRQDDAGIRDSERRVHALIRRENERGLPAARIVLAGFSQGGAAALHTALRYPERLAGVMGLSTYLPLSDTVEAERAEANADIPIFMAHGSRDPVLAFELGETSRRRLEEGGYAVEWHEYIMEHQVCLDEIREIGVWLTRILDLSA